MFMTAISNSEIDAYNARGGAQADATDPKAAQERFLKLFVAQLNNQDPLNPLDNAQMTTQMAQINQVVGLQQVNETLKNLSAQFGWVGAMQGVQLVGRTVATEGNAVLVADGQARAAFNLAADAQSVTVEFLDANGAMVGTVNAGARSAGLQTLQWSLGDVDPARVATIRVSATGAGGQAVEATPLALQRVQSVGVVDGTVRLRTERGTLSQDRILAYL
ncbi:flagellar hook assembly protein FlgD [Tepidimonas taiwanensis]|uniref:Basal-body rod modification protein FlgD n=1 Tax=Tepidimonas taiwanensis TaxID=307486 RepID=A0A554XCF5_9BURK|nr:flagellar hook capping FlgD N-terminal domain-containing protein [Tepidimonas taiwanensis]MCX7693290.1 flagellar hook assembly protein FlgD [Tepidimonas taiwanensis]MDM7464219.1 flagellar hook capping FlgD N-terminal domain-containing protein [Tepidimonas taiwanensis]TSE33521.1 Basal-body rod modification protein FlgD [Tepidimonas taiwanensis]UBQ05777.1 flagellar hook assembly protein FlgD [Tepidimonas taiwanensis]